MIQRKKELIQLSAMVKQYQEENEEVRKQSSQMDEEKRKAMEKLLLEQKKVKELRVGGLKDEGKVFVEEGKAELTVDTANEFGFKNAIS